MWEDVYESVDKILFQDGIQEILKKTLTDRERKIIYFRYWEEMTYVQIGKHEKVHRERASQIERKVLRKLRKRELQCEFEKLGIPFLEKHFQKIREEEDERLEKNAREWEAWKEKRRNQPSIKEFDHPSLYKSKKIEIPLLEEIIEPESRSLYAPPYQVQLKYTQNNEPYLWIDPRWGSISREKDPQIYDRWLKYLLDEKDDVNRVELYYWRFGG